MAALLDANQDPSRANDENAKCDASLILRTVLQLELCFWHPDTHLCHCRTLWMGDLAYWMDENFLYSLFVPT